MFKTSFLLVALPVILNFQAIATPLVPTPPCPKASLATYIAMEGGTCAVGELGFSNFRFSVLSASGGANPLSPSDITVTPTFTPGLESLPKGGLSFSSTGFSVTGNQSVTYLLGYSIDPHPIIVNLDDVLDASSPVFPGIAEITTNLCIGGPFIQGTLSQLVCGQAAGSPPSFSTVLDVFDNGIGAELFDTTGTFNRVNFVDVRNTILLSANGQKADFNKFSNAAGYIPDTVLIPEPASCGLIGGGLLTLWYMSRRRASL